MRARFDVEFEIEAVTLNEVKERARSWLEGKGLLSDPHATFREIRVHDLDVFHVNEKDL